MFSKTIGYAVSATVLATLAACGGGSSGLSSSTPVTPQSVNVPPLIRCRPRIWCSLMSSAN